MAERTTFRTGGAARVLLEPTSEAELAEALDWAKAKALSVFALGRGSNLVVSDRGYDGAVVSLGGLGGIEWDGPRVRAQAGVRLSELVLQAVERGLCGLEKLAGIPGSAGAAVAINAGAYGQEFCDRIVSVRSISPDLAVVQRDRDTCAFGYRTSVFHGSEEIILSADLELSPGDRDELRASVRQTQKARLEKQPLDLPNAGSLFKRPPNGYASKMVEEAGLKGFRVGNAAISEKHAGFAVNLGGATAQNVWDLSSEVIRRVHEFNGTALEREVVFLGKFD